MPIEFTNPGESKQRVARGWSDDFMDQHGRRFAATYELSNQRPIGELQPVGFHAPWLPPMRFIRWDRPGGFHFQWTYEDLANELVGDATVYYASVMEFMLEHMKGEPIPEMGEPVPAMVLRSPLGSPPLSPAIVLACQAGDPWALGTPGAEINTVLKASLEQSTTSTGRQALLVVREKMAKLAGANAVPTLAPDVDKSQHPARSIKDDAPIVMSEVTYQEFVASCRGRGKMNMPEIVQAWKDHKAFMAEQDELHTQVA